MNSKTLAMLVSRVLEPMVVLAVIALIGGLKSGLTGNSLILYYLLVVSLSWLVFRYRLKLVKRGINWDISERKKRVKPLFILLWLLIFVYWLISKLNNPFIAQTFLLFLSWTIGFWLITLVYKISGHIAVLTLTCGLIVAWFGLQFWPVYLTIPLLSWSRVSLKAHTLGQVIVGFFYSLLFI